MVKNLLAKPWFRLAAAAAVGVVIVVGIVAAKPVVDHWFHKSEASDPDDKAKANRSHELVRDAAGRPVNPPALRISAEAALTLGITPKTVVPAQAAVDPRPLPPLEGTLAYNNDNLFPVRPRFAGEVVEFTQVPNDALQPEPAGTTPERYKGWQATRPVGFGDKVKRGDLLAIVWSKDLGDKKAALIDATIDLRRDRQRLKELEKLYQEGAVSAATYYESQRVVQKDISAANAAERTLRIWKLTDPEIEALKKEAATIQADNRDAKKEKDWARVEVRAPHDGTIVEKNTNVGDWVDPSNGNPMFRIADLTILAAWLHPLEEYLPVLSRLTQRHNPDDLFWRIRLVADARQPPLEGPILRIAPSIDPTQRTLLVMGQVANPTGRLLVGESISAIIYVRPEPNLVVIPTTALNEVNGQSVVFVQPDPNKPEYVLRRVAVTERLANVVFVRSKLIEEDKEALSAAAGNGVRPIEPLVPGERVVTQGVPMLTVALRELLAKEALTKTAE
jgi:cobalt-zinc-cadmium efflux system membrane fusion protein